jgi:MFS family permease
MSSLRKTFKAQDQVTSKELEKGLKFIVYDGICTQSMGALTGGAFLVAFALGLGASNFYIGLLAAIPFFAQTIQIPAVFLVEKVRARRGLSVIFSGVSRMFWYPIALIPILFVNNASAGLYLLIAALVLHTGMGAVAGTSWNSWMRDLIPQEILGRFFSRRMMIATAVGVVLTLLAGVIVDVWKANSPEHPLHIYSILFIAGMTVGLVGLYFLWRTPEPDMNKQGEVPSMRSLFSRPLRDVNFRRLLIFSVPWSFAVNLVTPFFTVYLLQRLGYSLSLVVGLSVLSQLTNIAFLRVWGRLSDRFSNKSILSVSGPLFLLCILAWPYTTMPDKYFLTIPLVIAIHILSGISMAGVTLGTSNIALKLSPSGYATSYIATSGILNSLSAGIASLVGGAIGYLFASKELILSFEWSEPGRQMGVSALSLEGLDFLFVIAAVIGLYSVYRLHLVREKGEVKERIIITELTAEVMQQMRSLSTIGGLRQLTSLPLYIARDTLRKRYQQRNNRKNEIV